MGKYSFLQHIKFASENESLKCWHETRVRHQKGHSGNSLCDVMQCDMLIENNRTLISP